jgi:hypothetical protein
MKLDMHYLLLSSILLKFSLNFLLGGAVLELAFSSFHPMGNTIKSLNRGTKGEQKMQTDT